MQPTEQINDAAMKRQARRTLFVIGLFAFVYLAIIAISLVIAFYSAKLLYVTITKVANPITIPLAACVTVVCCMFTYFLIRSLFYNRKPDLSGLVEITEADEPQLFSLIREITEKLQTRFPAHVYLCQSVTASVNTDISFHHLLFKPKRSLWIGAGLLSSLHREELKAVLAHEFGHFSQKHLKAGSYLYYVNHVIHSIAHDQNFQTQIAKFSGRIPFVVYLGVFAIQAMRGIQWITVRFHGIVNRSYMALSRELEFHADACAGYCAPPNALGNALMRIELTETCFHELIQFYSNGFHKGYTTKNIYPQLEWLIAVRASEFRLKLRNQLPEVQLDDIRYFDSSRVVIQDQWASHPSTEDRVTRLMQIPNQQSYSDDSAWSILSNPQKLQERVTWAMNEHLIFPENTPPLYLDQAEFVEKFTLDIASNSFHSDYKSIYNAREIERFDLTAEAADEVRETPFTEEIRNTYFRFLGLRKDELILSEIVKGSLKVSTFDFDGVKYKKKKADTILRTVTEDLYEAQQVLKETDRRAYRYFRSQASKENAQHLNQLYQDYFSMCDKCDGDRKYFQIFMDHTSFLNNILEYDTIRYYCSELRKEEQEFKPRLKYHYTDKQGKEHIPEDLQKKVDEYLSKHHTYFFHDKYDETKLDLLRVSIEVFQFLLDRNLYEAKKKLLDFQISLVN